MGFYGQNPFCEITIIRNNREPQKNALLGVLDDLRSFSRKRLRPSSSILVSGTVLRPVHLPNLIVTLSPLRTLM